MGMKPAGLHTNHSVQIQDIILWSFEILITNILALTYSFYFDYIIPM